MHRLAATPGGWTPDQDGVIFVEQTVAPIVMLTSADTDIQTIAIAAKSLPPDFPPLRVANLLNLQQELAIDTYADTVLAHADVIILRLLGGRSYWSYGLEVCKALISSSTKKLIVLPGDDGFDPDLVSHANVPLEAVNQLWQYFLNGGVENAIAALQFVADLYLGTNYQPDLPQAVPKIGLYQFSWIDPPQPPLRKGGELIELIESPFLRGMPQAGGSIGILFYRAHFLAGNLAPIDALCRALCDRDLTPIPIFIYSLQDPDLESKLKFYFENIDVLLNTTSFSLMRPGTEDKRSIWRSLNVPMLQVIFSSSTVAQWQNSSLGLSPRDVAMNVALPEVDGRIITRAVSFKSVAQRDEQLETDVVVYEPVADRIDFVANLAQNWSKLKRKSVGDRKVALILANYPTRNGRLGNGVGLDTPASVINILKAMQQEGYAIENIPADGNALIEQLTQGITNDPENQSSIASARLSVASYQAYFEALPEGIRERVSQRWGDPTSRPYAIAGIQLGNVFVGIQPSRGYDRDPSLNYHAPDLEPTHDYLAFYVWLREIFQTDAIAHIGKHGNLEWLPGKGLALSESCFPEAALGALPHLYPFIVNDPGEGAQAKRRAQAVIIDHLTPPMTRAETYGNLQKLEHLIDEYQEAQTLNPSRSSLIQAKILELIEQENLDRDLANLTAPVASQLVKDKGLMESGMDKRQFSELIAQTDGYLCELKEAQIRDGLHIFGQCPEGRQLRDLIIAIARNPGSGQVGITQAIAQSFYLDFDPLTVDPSRPFTDLPLGLQAYLDSKCQIVGDAIAAIENYAAQLVDKFIGDPPQPPLRKGGELIESPFSSEMPQAGESPQQNGEDPPQPPLKKGGELYPLSTIYEPLRQTEQEITNFLRGLNAEYIPSGSSGAPTRGRLDVLPTGRNFYSVDIRAIPTETAWDVGRRSAEILVETYTQEHGEYPRTLGLSVWGTSTMRTGGDDIAEAMALLGVRPVWDGISRRVVDFEVLPLSILGRPRVDVMLRISGFFRDGFANLISLFHQAVQTVSQLDEPDQMNPLKAQIEKDAQVLIEQGCEPEQAISTAQFRVFGSKPGAYGAGLQGLMESQNWEDEQDLASAYINWGGYAYTGYEEAQTAPAALKQRLSQLQIVLQNQDNREHDLVDSDDYYQFQGGMIAAVRALSGKNPQAYFGDNSRSQSPKVRSLAAEISRVYRSRVVNPKWIEGVMRHGYKGAFEMSATVDFMFGYDATANCVEDFMYEGVAQAYLFDPKVQEFIRANNPWALRDMSERLLEAHQRGLWQDISDQMREDLRSLVLSSEAAIELKSEAF